jgi:phosphoglycerate dehydrogenase-like enzyme
VTADLVAALDSGAIAGAGLDVTAPEPLPEGHVLWTMPRVIISPHTGGRSDKGRDRLFLLVQENLRRYVAGEPMLSVVDIERGY